MFRNDAFDESWCQSMVKLRHEFGFDEPHPRWGRVPENKALTYALQVLQEVIIPIHRHFHDRSDQLSAQEDDECPNDATPSAYTFQSMLTLYNSAIEQMHAAHCIDTFLNHAITQLERGIRHLQEGSHDIPNLPPTLVHMDCQPQNILFANPSDSNKPVIVSVLDWEDSAIADPRFELVMLGRKVCANRTQALTIWKTYEEAMQIDLGGMELWLQLETVHSLTTLLLQSLDLLHGSRSPWESKPDLMQKIERELHRLQASIIDTSGSLGLTDDHAPH